MTAAVLLLVVVDRIEEPMAVLELPDRTTVDISLDHLPRGLQEGDRLLLRARALPPRRAPRRGAVPPAGVLGGAQAPVGE